MHPTVEVVYLDTVYYLFPPSAQFLQQKGIPGLCIVSDVQEGLTFLDSVTFKFGSEDQLHELLHNHSGTPTSRSALFQTIAEAMVDGRITIIRAGGYDLWQHAQTELNCGQSARVDAFKETKGFAVLSHFQKNPNTLAPDDYNSTLCEGEDLLLDYQEEQLGQGRSVGPLLGGGSGFPFRAAMFNGTLLDKVSYGSLLRQRAIRVDAQQRKAVRRTWDKSGAGNGSTNTQSATSSTSSAASATSSRTDMLANRHTRFVDELKSEQAQSENNQATNASETNSDTEKHTLDLFCERQDAKPASGLPFKVTFLNDGSEQSGTLDSQGSYHMDGLEPGAVAVEFGEAPDDGAIAATRAQITSALAEVIAEEKAEAAEYEAKFANMNPLEKAIVVEAHAEKGFFNAGVGLVMFAYDVVKAAHPLSMLNKAYGAAKAAYTTEDEDWIGIFVDNYQQANHEDLINVLGFDPAQISREQMAEAFEIASLIYEDAETQAILKDFASEYAASQHTLEWAEFAGGAAFEIVLGAVLAAATGGAGTAAVAASKARMMKSLAKLQPLFKKLATQLKGKYRFKQKSGQTNSFIKVKLEKPNMVEVPSAKEITDGETVVEVSGQPPKKELAHSIEAFEITVSPNAKNHLANYDGFERPKGIKGAHNESQFLDATKKHADDLEIIDSQPVQEGITQYRYGYKKQDRAGNYTGEIKEYKMPKTVYDPKIYSDDEMYSIGLKAAKKEYQSAITEGKTAYTAEQNGITFRVYLDRASKEITNFHPK
ncbi:hypothetical protein OLMES_1339 [Oleiphilus messinensis]|uniref:Bacterial EndoU nuclease domain-containing protein n=1 Tax=Oleiphilus messinensis TaxID=141451 RepID=A0A1Y0I4K1_9GAMM|nr:CdiA family toxin C-terminal domain-containing protein [Oleiphilus messinensis]ARU55417.1 hypothetical protein OLMES_1339 [Oleiphilus messinensis]